MQERNHNVMKDETSTQEMLPIVLAIDPSIKNLGWACLNLNKVEDGDYYNLSSEGWSFGLIHPKGRNTQHRWKDTYLQLKMVLDEDKQWPTHYASEWPVFFDSTKGRIAAQQNYTIDLAAIVGYIAGQFKFKPDYQTLWTPGQWKGSVPKHVTEHKFVRLFGRSAERLSRTLSNDVIDAIMIAEYWLSIYAKGKFSWQQRNGSGTGYDGPSLLVANDI